MKIQASQLQLEGWHSASRQQSSHETTTVRRQPASAATPSAASVVDLSAEALASQHSEGLINLRDALANNPLWQLIQQLVKKLTGRDIDIDDIVPSGAIREAPAASSNSPSVQWQIERRRIETIHETEQTRFRARGQIETADGRQIAVRTDLLLSRRFSEQREVSEQLSASAIRKKDPLVLNYANASASLSPDKVSFDLDADGSQDQISFLAPGSGFLALDRNGDGRVNDGRELFGIQSGDGFADLAGYDDDGNGWIDEADAAWGQLSLWQRDAQGEESLQSLASFGIGALYLGRARTDFSLRDQANQEHGQIRQTGLFLSESGEVGTLQHVDLVA